MQTLIRKIRSYLNISPADLAVSLANDICRAYRREGRFFDEILDEAKAGGKL